MDYIACGRMERKLVTEVVEGIAHACKAVDIPLVGGELAEMPGVYQTGEYDVVGFVVGRTTGEADRTSVPKAGDLLIGVPSSGFHTNGYSLVRKVVFETGGLDVGEWVEELGSTVGEALLKPHRCYHAVVSRLIEKTELHGIVHITGGGFQGNIPRVLPEGLKAVVDTRKWIPAPVFRWMARLGKIDPDEMYRTFNMGIGMVFVVPPMSLDLVEREIGELGEESLIIGELVQGRREVELIR
jgi:phosphoribosylformylglycinamidine cyclo-ligase